MGPQTQDVPRTNTGPADLAEREFDVRKLLPEGLIHVLLQV